MFSSLFYICAGDRRGAAVPDLHGPEAAGGGALETHMSAPRRRMFCSADLGTALQSFFRDHKREISVCVLRAEEHAF